MARAGADALVKRNSKLEAFLKKAWEEDTFERLRAHEACIVCSDREDKAFKFAVLTDEWIYLTENPPKKIQEEVHLKNIVSIELVNDLPEFLQGDEQAHTQHILITYMTPEPVKDKKRSSIKEKSPRRNGSARGAATSRTARDTARKDYLSVGYFERKSQNGANSSRIPHRDRGGSVDEESLRKSLESREGKNKKRHLSSSDSGSSRSVPNGRPLPNVRSAISDSKLGASHSDSDLIGMAHAGSKSHSANLASTMLNRYSSTKYQQVRKLPRPLPNPTEEWDENGEYVDKRKKEPSRLSVSENGELKLDLRALKDDDDDTFSISSSNSKSLLKVPKIKLSSTSSDAGHASESGGSARSWGESDEIFEDGMEEEETWKKSKLHLYILNPSSAFLMLTRCSWNNYLIRATLMREPEFSDRTVCLTSRKPKGYSEKFDKLFGQLKTELLNPHNSMEENFELLNELKTATERNFALKKLFWKSSELFAFIVRQLQKYLPRSAYTAAIETVDEAKTRRADEFEMVILLVETLALMFRETETLPSRLQAIQSSSGKCALDLLVVLTCIPDIPQRHVPMSAKAARLTGSVASEQWKSLADAELAKLEKEFTNAATIVVSELILIAHQANWGDSDGNFFNICWLVKVLDELNTTEKFVERLVTQMLRLISPSRLEELQPNKAVLVFHQFSVLQTMVEYSSRVVGYIRNNFYEEFKYYIQAPVIQQKLPKYYPITSYTMRLIQEVVSTILQREVRICPKEDLSS